MRYAATIAALVLTLGVSACAGPKQQEFTRADAEAIKKSTADFTAAFNNKQLDKVIEFYVDHSVLMPPNKPLLRGRDRGKYIRVLRLMKGNWRLEKTIWSSDLPVQSAHAD